MKLSKNYSDNMENMIKNNIWMKKTKVHLPLKFADEDVR